MRLRQSPGEFRAAPGPPCVLNGHAKAQVIPLPHGTLPGYPLKQPPTLYHELTIPSSLLALRGLGY